MRGSTLNHFIDDTDVRRIRKQLRRPKHDAPGMSHALHDLFEAYVVLETRHLELQDKVNRAREALKP